MSRGHPPSWAWCSRREMEGNWRLEIGQDWPEASIFPHYDGKRGRDAIHQQLSTAPNVCFITTVPLPCGRLSTMMKWTSLGIPSSTVSWFPLTPLFHRIAREGEKYTQSLRNSASYKVRASRSSLSRTKTWPCRPVSPSLEVPGNGVSVSVLPGGDSNDSPAETEFISESDLLFRLSQLRSLL